MCPRSDGDALRANLRSAPDNLCVRRSNERSCASRASAYAARMSARPCPSTARRRRPTAFRASRSAACASRARSAAVRMALVRRATRLARLSSTVSGTSTKPSAPASCEGATNTSFSRASSCSAIRDEARHPSTRAASALSHAKRVSSTRRRSRLSCSCSTDTMPVRRRRRRRYALAMAVAARELRARRKPRHDPNSWRPS
mmetsp:Transcript_3027/g.9303  ORF Transcript_3027/g.9303 Transcript_3027/m.9303 type:complete len:201 (+) Transcript_3027:988-1590(+)